MEPRISLITLGVADLSRAITFYEEVLGWKAEPGPPGIAFFNLNGVVFSLFPDKDLAKDYGGRSEGGGAYQGFALAHNVDSRDRVDEIFAVLRERGATIVKEPEVVSWGGYSGYFEDPDGHKWEVAHNPYWSFRDDGRIVMGS